MGGKPDYNVVSFSGGKDSTAMLLMMLEKNVQIDEVIWCDVGMEFPQMYDHIKKVEEYTGITFTKLKSEKSFEYYMFDHIKTKGKRKGEAGYGWPNTLCRWCTKTLKTSLIDGYLSELKKRYNVVEYVGIAADEMKRIKNKRYPLVEWGVTEADALKYCYRCGFDWGGLYEHFDRVSCWCCPLKNLKELRMLYHFYPELWSKLKEMDERASGLQCNNGRKFRKDYSVKQLEEKFDEEDRLNKQNN